MKPPAKAATYRPAFGHYIGPWRPAFAWLPTALFDGHRVWLRKIQRRRVQAHEWLNLGHDAQWWVYKLPGDPA